MSKIKQLAEKYAQEAYSNPVDRNVGKADFIAGANAVLREIEKAMDLGEPPYLISVEQAYYKAKEIIKELKGE